ncbi:MAG: alpha/beta hydrolase, partial [Deltaproteobacteria bacterium]|nr:alpha/beta hydrolase [Deltaproteobacteria bacterium]
LMTCFKLNQGSDGPVKRLILIGSASYKQRLPYFIKGVSMPVFNALSHWLLPPRTSSWLVLRFCYYDGKKISDDQVRVYAAYMGLPGSRYSLMKTAQQIIPSNVKELTERFQTISIPVLVLWGEGDKVIPVKLGRRLAENIPGARLVVLPKCGHMPQEESPQETLELVKDFLHENRADCSKERRPPPRR